MPANLNQKRKHFYTRFPIWLSVIILVGLSPFIVGFIGANLTELTTGEPCHEGNCYWGVIPWVGIFVTLPISAVLLIIYFIIVLVDSIKLKKK